jgi:Tfp pilus assembly protein PilO
MNDLPAILINPRHAGIAATAGCAMVTTLAYLFVFGPAFRSDADGATGGPLGAKLERLDANASELRSARALLQRTDSSIQAQQLNLQRSTQLNLKLTTLVQLAEKNALSVSALQPGTPGSDPDYVVVPLTLTASADYNSIRSFLHDLRQTNPDALLTSMVITRDGHSKKPLTLQAGLLWQAARSGAPASSPDSIAGVSR